MSEIASTTTLADREVGASGRAEPAWGAVLSLSLGVFALVTAEFLPASLLTRMAADLGISVGLAGQAVTATAVVAMLTALGFAVVIGNLDRRVVLWTLTILLVVSNLIAATAGSLTALLLARVALGVSLGGFWSMVAALILRLVPAPMVPRAMAFVMMGVSAATVCAAPLGAYLGDLFGWRATFMLAAGLGVPALAAQMATMPRLPAITEARFGTLLELLGRPRLRIGLGILVVVISGHIAGYTYIRPFLERVSALDIEGLSLVLLAFGIAGFFGNLVGGFVAERSINAAVGFGSLLVAAMALVLILLGSSQVVAGIAVAIWGFGFAWLPVGFQAWLVRSAPDQAEGAGGLFVAAFQIAISSGAVLGGLLVDSFGPIGAVTYCAFGGVLGALLVVGLGRAGGR